MQHVPAFLKKIDLGHNVIFRGHADSTWELKPSVGRHHSGEWSWALEWEMDSLEEFKKRSIPYLKVNPSSDIEWLCLMQHHGCATRLLDFTTNPLIALFFASDPSNRNDGEVIIAKYGRTYKTVRDEKLFERTNNFAYHPPHITDRIIGQSGCFVYSSTPNLPLHEKQIESIKVLRGNKGAIRLELKNLGISYSSLFPSIDGVCQDLNDNLILGLETQMPF